jgi:DNA polymerase-3 subunit gamma/tau
VQPAAEPAPIRQAPKGVSENTEAMSGGQPDWGVLLTQLNVQGMAQQLAKHCVLQCFSDGKMVLCLSQEHKHLQSNKSAVEKLQAALSDYFVKPVRLNIVLGKTETATPAVVEQQARQIKQEQANDAIARDDFVREAQAELDADLVAESVKPVQ